MMDGKIVPIRMYPSRLDAPATLVRVC